MLLRAERTRSSPVLLRTGTRTLLEDNPKREGSMLGPGTGGVTAGSASSSAELPKTEEHTAKFRIERAGTTEAENARITFVFLEALITLGPNWGILTKIKKFVPSKQSG